jgi:hypothetical protein
MNFFGILISRLLVGSRFWWYYAIQEFSCYSHPDDVSLRDWLVPGSESADM